MHNTTGVSPTELLLGCRSCTFWDLALPNISNRAVSNQEKQHSHDKSADLRKFEVGDLVYIRDFPSNEDTTLIGVGINCDEKHVPK